MCCHTTLSSASGSAISHLWWWLGKSRILKIQNQQFLSKFHLKFLGKEAYPWATQDAPILTQLWQDLTNKFNIDNFRLPSLWEFIKSRPNIVECVVLLSWRGVCPRLQSDSVLGRLWNMQFFLLIASLYFRVISLILIDINEQNQTLKVSNLGHYLWSWSWKTWTWPIKHIYRI